MKTKVALVLLLIVIIIVLIGCSGQNEQDIKVNVDALEIIDEDIIGYWAVEEIPEVKDTEMDLFRGIFSSEKIFFGADKTYTRRRGRDGKVENTYKVFEGGNIKIGEEELKYFIEEEKLMLFSFGTKDEQKPIIYKKITQEEFEDGWYPDFEFYMKKHYISITGRDVQYDIENNLGQKFAVEGTLTLDDYYNYGFNHDIEQGYFNAQLTPPNGAYNERWYLYFHRDGFRELFEDLKEHPVNIYGTCVIPSYFYKRGQGNMAEVTSVVWWGK